ncbi:MAG: TetR/AcrR family transcriptional regulator [Alphaproteobacteria bacterium]|nr:TetR/AcrR family transcriptional regulator [Alphaproteobacteria bacterium]
MVGGDEQPYAAVSVGEPGVERGDPTAIVRAAMTCFAARGFAATSLDDIADAALIPPAALRAIFPDKGAIIRAFTAGVDRAVLAAPVAVGAPLAQRFRAVLWHRLDVMAPHRDGLARVIGEIPGTPAFSVPVGVRAFRSMRRMLDHVGIETTGAAGRMRVRAACFLYAEVLRRWFADRSSGWQETARALDSGLATLGHLAPAMRAPR